MRIRDRIKELRRVRARDLVPHPRNWRAHPAAQQEALRGLLSELGYCDAALARELPDGRLQLIDGHLRAETTPDMEVPVLVLDVTEAEADKLLVTLDPLAGLAEARREALNELLASVETDSGAVQALLASLGAGDFSPFVETTHVGLADPDIVPEPPEQAVTHSGDFWALGRHRLLCGDSAEAADVDRLLEGAPIHLVNTDPPCAVRVEPRINNAIAAGLSSFHGPAVRSGKARRAGKKPRAKDRPLASDLLPDEEFERLLQAWLSNLARVLLPGRSFYIWGGRGNLGTYPPLLKRCGLHFSQGVIWDTQHPVQTHNDFMRCFEFAFFGWREGAAHHFYGPSNAPDLWSIQKVNSQHMADLSGKPLELAARALAYSSRPGEHVLDLFGGSGSTLIAAEQAGRRAFLIESDPLYCDVIVARWERLTGKKAERQWGMS
jgi:DNA modification methylase